MRSIKRNPRPLSSYDGRVEDQRLQTVVCERIREAARRKGLSVNRLADFAGLSSSYLSAVLRGEKSPTLRTLDRVATALEIDPFVLLGPEPREPRK